MKTTLSLFSLGFFTLSFSAHAWFHYPEERNYSSQDRGFAQYGTPSLHGKNEYVLTFDDGPHATHTPKLLDILKKYQVKATFFAVTSRINRQTQPIVKRILDEGHILASHLHEHDNSNTLGEASFKQKLKQSFLDLRDAYAQAGHAFDKFYFRFPYAAYGERADYHHMNALREVSRELFDDNCIHFVFWDIDSSDWVPNMTAAEVFGNLRAYQEGTPYLGFRTVVENGRTTYVKVPRAITPTYGGVVLQHDIQERTLAATEMFLKYTQDNGIKLTRLDDTKEFAIVRSCEFRQ